MSVTDQLSSRLVPDELWELVQPYLPKFRPRPQGGGTAPLPDRQVFTAIVYVLTSGCAWRDLPPSFGVPFQTAHRRFSQWTKAGVWPRLHRAVLDELGSQGLIGCFSRWTRAGVWPRLHRAVPDDLGRRGLIDWSRAIADAACVRARKGAP